ncbi:MAG: thiamine-phosphate kinase [Phycisphaerales bacterium]
MREFDLLHRVFALNARLPATVLVPPGDDMAVLSLEGARALLVAADSAIEGRHAPRGCDPYLIGRKAVLRNLSDVAAMGAARPIATIACVTLPAGIAEAAAWRLYEGLRETAEAWSAPLVGGDVATVPSEHRDAPIIASVTILAVPLREGARLATRADARDGDGIYVTGSIGGAWDPATGLGRHLDFTPRIAIAHQLAEQLGERLGAMIDVSDGLGRDLWHIAERSGRALEVDLARVPITPGCDARAAIGHGEDYELAFTARGEVPELVAGVPVTRIGVVRDRMPAVTIRDGAESWDARRAGFEHDGGGVRPSRDTRQP